jgi:hypothetical protein
MAKVHKWEVMERGVDENRLGYSMKGGSVSGRGITSPVSWRKGEGNRAEEASRSLSEAQATGRDESGSLGRAHIDKRVCGEQSPQNRKLIERRKPESQQARLDRVQGRAELIKKASPEILISG